MLTANTAGKVHPSAPSTVRPLQTLQNAINAKTMAKTLTDARKTLLIFNFSSSGNSSSNSSPPPDVPSADAVAAEPYRSDIDLPARAAISKRKVASAPAAPAYKGNCVYLDSLWRCLNAAFNLIPGWYFKDT